MSSVILKQVDKTYRLGAVTVPALASINLEIRPNRFTVISGASGSGKTTLRRVFISKPDRSQHALGILCLKISNAALLLVNYVPYDSHVWKTVNNAGSNDRLARVTPISHTSTALRKPPFLSAFQRLRDIRARVVKCRQPSSEYHGSKHHGADHGIEGPGNVDE